jgi:predicted acylesterase/phospholipase RssA
MTDTEQAPLGGEPELSCDIVLKGGITSGVVYPLALVALAEKYRFSSIGGTSAGAIAAAAAAAAEYGRHIKNAGFDRLKHIPTEVGPHLLSLFQPTPTLRPLFDIFVAALKANSTIGRATSIAWTALKGYRYSAVLGILPGLVIIVLALLYRGGAGFVLLGLLAAPVGLATAIVVRLWKAANTDLVASDFGLCPGLRQPYSGSEGFTDWLARLIDEAAGRVRDNDSPLTFGDLAKPPGGRPPIQLAMMTTSLMERRPYTLPLKDRRFFFKCSEWDKLFPAHVMAFLTGVCERFIPPAGEPGEYYYFPDEATLPLIVGARMSLSFPGLISAVPLWVRDFTLTEEAEQNKLRRCLFSDGGLSSNFPIQFFDRLLPNNPTFAITLDQYDDKRNYDGNVWLPKTSGSGIQLPIEPFEGLGAFLMRLVDSAKDWQDNLQSTLPGYRERIAHVALKPEDGGLNLAMDEQTILKLVGYGEQAGELLRDKFDLDSHRWRRFLVAMARMEETLDDVAEAYDGLPGGEPFGDFLARYPGTKPPYAQGAVLFAAMLQRGRELAAVGTAWRAAPTIRSGHIPQPATNLRITAKP